MFEHRVAVRLQVFAVKDRALKGRLVEEHFENAPTFDQRRFPEIEALQVQKVERIEQETVLVAFGEVGLQLGKAGAALFDDHDLTVEDRALDGNVERAGNTGRGEEDISEQPAGNGFRSRRDLMDGAGERADGQEAEDVPDFAGLL
jgi:hypothetical protein